MVSEERTCYTLYMTREMLTNGVERQPMKSKKVTIKDVAKEAGVSVATVSRALNGLGGIGEETRDHVLEICERMAYVPSTLASGLTMHHTRTLGIVMPDITSPFYAQLMVLLTSEAKQYGYQVLLCNSFRDYETETECFKLLIGNRVEGILFYPVGDMSSKNLYQFMRYLPIVALNEMPDTSPIPYVCGDERKGGRLAAERIIRGGCRRILCIGMKEDRLVHRYRMEGILEEAGQRGAEIEVCKSDKNYKSSFERGYGQADEVIRESLRPEGKPLPDGVIAASDATANGVVKACLEHGISIPGQMSVIGFDDINGAVPAVELTTVSISHKLHVKRAMDLLIRMKEERFLKEQERAVKLRPALIERNSCHGDGGCISYGLSPWGGAI